MRYGGGSVDRILRSALMLQLENFLFGYAAAFVRDLWNMMDELQPKVAAEDAPRVLSAEEGRVAKILASKEAPEWLRVAWRSRQRRSFAFKTKSHSLSLDTYRALSSTPSSMLSPPL